VQEVEGEALVTGSPFQMPNENWMLSSTALGGLAGGRRQTRSCSEADRCQRSDKAICRMLVNYCLVLLREEAG